MSEIKALEKLRKYGLDVCWRIGGWPKHPADMANEIADAIQAEIAERFIELPVDADGLPLEIDEKMEYRDEQFTLKCLAWDGSYWFATDEYANSWRPVNRCHHVMSPRTLEDTLSEFAPRWMDAFNPERKAMLVKEYADEIRGMFGGNAE